jgi:hypothetical protein
MGDTVATVLKSLQGESAAFLSALQTTLPTESDAFDTPKAPSLLVLKNAALLSYLQHLVLITSGRLRGHSVEDGSQGKGPALVRNLIELRLVLEKVRPLESKTRTLIDRLLRAADDDDRRIREGRLEDDHQGGALSGQAGSIGEFISWGHRLEQILIHHSSHVSCRSTLLPSQYSRSH